MNQGWIAVHRKILENPACTKDSDHAWLWIVMLLKANHDDNFFIWNGKKVTCKRGQFLTSRKSLAKESGIQESKIERILKCFKSDQQIEQQNMYTNRLITIKNYDKYQQVEQQNERQMNSKRTASEQQVNTNNNENNENKKKKQTKKKPAMVKKAYGEFENVELSDSEYKKLLDKFGEDGTHSRIENLSLGIESKGYKYSSHYATILNWERRREEKNPKPKEGTKEFYIAEMKELGVAPFAHKHGADLAEKYQSYADFII